MIGSHESELLKRPLEWNVTFGDWEHCYITIRVCDDPAASLVVDIEDTSGGDKLHVPADAMHDFVQALGGAEEAIHEEVRRRKEKQSAA
ncbi:MAG: hypothetical protein ACE149_17605 [Armatimonadota bacterium]